MKTQYRKPRQAIEKMSTGQDFTKREAHDILNYIEYLEEAVDVLEIDLDNTTDALVDAERYIDKYLESIHDD